MFEELLIPLLKSKQERLFTGFEEVVDVVHIPCLCLSLPALHYLNVVLGYERCFRQTLYE